MIDGLIKSTPKSQKFAIPSPRRGKAVVMFFGYTQCPDFCPTTLSELAETMKRLGADADRVFPKDAKLGMGGRRYHAKSELPPDIVIVRVVKLAVALNEAGERPKRVRRCLRIGCAKSPDCAM